MYDRDLGGEPEVPSRRDWFHNAPIQAFDRRFFLPPSRTVSVVGRKSESVTVPADTTKSSSPSRISAFIGNHFPTMEMPKSTDKTAVPLAIGSGL